MRKFFFFDGNWCGDGGDGGDAALTNCKADKTDTKSSKMFKQ